MNNEWNKGFTFIEIILVVAIVSISLLFAAPNYINQVGHANEIHISSDLMIIQDSIKNFLTRKGVQGIEEFNSSLNGEYKAEEIYELVEGKRLYTQEGLVKMEDILKRQNDGEKFDSYYEINHSFLEKIGVESKLNGKFIIKKISTNYWDDDKETREELSREIDSLKLIYMVRKGRKK